MVRPMVHLNGHLLCAVSIETTGPIPVEHEIWQVGILPLDWDFCPDKTLMPFGMNMKVHHPKQFDKYYVTDSQLAQSCLSGVDPYVAADMLETWFDRINLPENKKIMPLVHDWLYVGTFLRQWLQPYRFQHLFHVSARDILPVSLFSNDSAERHCEQIPYPKNDIRYLFSTLRVDRDFKRDCLLEAQAIGQCYKRMLKKLF